ncbi:hypothetical protein O6H91_13G064900 [Diphasiastrum complanatum]|uniref:Uncharacterized protein n=1 Tax=Diphasiastrum complanatum TaxID=34168 RepID=A0ACC2BVI4_DIPCM|nr:hypothetical protein O6H91_13G064900 [Diphasiastrum complanatum]
MAAHYLLYIKFPSPIRSYDVHIYFFETDETHTALARALQAEIKEKFQELEVYKFWAHPIGPHPIGNFEIDLKSPEEFLLFVPWIQVNRRGLSVLVHPNTGNSLKDHTENAIWIGEKQVLNTRYLNEIDDGYGYY